VLTVDNNSNIYLIRSLGQPKRGGPPALGLDVELKMLTVKNKLVTNICKKPQILDKRPNRKKLEMGFGSWMLEVCIRQVRSGLRWMKSFLPFSSETFVFSSSV
jgi:hypothetical protein